MTSLFNESPEVANYLVKWTAENLRKSSTPVDMPTIETYIKIYSPVRGEDNSPFQLCLIYCRVV